MYRNLAVGVFCLAGILFLASQEATAADCKALRSQVETETNLLKRRDMLQVAVKDCSEDPVLNFAYAQTLERLRKYEEALRYYSVASRYKSTRAKAFFGMGDIYSILGKPESAVNAYEQGLEADPNDERAKKSLAEVRQKYNIRGVKKAPPPPPPPPPPPEPAHVEAPPPVTHAPPPATVKGPDLKFQTPFSH